MNFLKMLCASMLVSCFALAQMPGDYVIATGQLQGANFLHRAQGEVKIVKMNQGIFLSLDQNFSVTRGPDLFLMLRNTKNDKAGMPILATLKQYSGSQMFKLEISERDLMKFDQIIIYCKRFSSLFAFSELNFN